jgi:hypothetical protein
MARQVERWTERQPNLNTDTWIDEQRERGRERGRGNRLIGRLIYERRGEGGLTDGQTNRKTQTSSQAFTYE